MNPSIVVGLEGTNGGLWCSPVAKTSSPASSTAFAMVTIALIRSRSVGVRPVVGWVEPPFDLAPDPVEVADVFEVPLDYLLDPAHHQRHLLQWQGQQREWFAMPYQDGEHMRFIWGATAGMLRNLYRFMLA